MADQELPDFNWDWAREADWMVIEKNARPDLLKALIDEAGPDYDQNEVESVLDQVIERLRIAFDKSRIELPFTLQPPFKPEATLLADPALSQKIAIFIKERDAAIGLAFGNLLFRKSIETLIEYAKYELRLLHLEKRLGEGRR